MRIKLPKPLLLFTFIFIASSLFSQTTTIHTYFDSENHELKVYHIKGREPGATLMVIGGIHGNETASFLGPDYFADIHLKKGNLILIPRANLPSIFASRRFINHDMNRRFAQEIPATYEDHVVEILKKYLRQSDLMLNLHEGSGFYRHTHEGPNHNPLKFGQCLIADADSLFIPELDKTIHLKNIAETVIAQINKRIDIEEHLYRFNNHDTLSRHTRHAEQRRSASFFTLTEINIPAFGVETSWDIPDLALRVRYQKTVISEFMNFLGIKRDYLHVAEHRPILHYLLVRVNDEKRYVEAGDTILLPENSSFRITKISTNYPRGNFVDVVGHGNRNDINKTFNIGRNTEIIVRKDHQIITRIPIRVTADTAIAFEGFRVNILDDDSYKNVFAGDTLFVTRGAEFEVIGALNNNRNINITIAGATPRQRQGRQIIDTATMSERFAINSTGTLYEIIVRDRNNVVANSFLQIRPLEAFGLHISHNGKRMLLAPGDTLIAEYNDVLFIHDVELNQLCSTKVRVNFAGYVVDPRREAEDRGGDITLNSRGLIPRFAVNDARDTYEIHILYGRQRYATYTVKINNVPGTN